MQTNNAFYAYEGFDDEVYTVYEDPANSLSDEFYDYYGTPQMPAYHCGSPFADYQGYTYETYHYDYNAVYYLQPTYLIYYPVINVQYSADYIFYPCYEYLPVYCQDYVFIYNYSPPITACYVNDTTCIYPPPVYESPSPVEPNVFPSEEFDFDLYNIENRYSNDKYESFEEKVGEEITTCHLFYEEYPEMLNGGPVEDEANSAASPGKKTSVNGDTVEEFSASRKFCSAVNDRRKILTASSQVKKTFINRGVVADPAEYRKFCDSIEDRLKKLRESAPEKKSTTDRDVVKASHRKFWSTVEERRKILNDSSVGKKSFVNRGIVADSASYRRFCRSVEDRIKNLGSPENSQQFGVKDFIDKQGSKVRHEERVVQEESSHHFMDMILKSAEYLHVQDNLKNSKHSRDLLYKQALRKQNKSTLMEILPSIIEEPFNFEDVTAECGELHVAEPRELDSNDEPKPVIIKTKQPKNRFKSFRNWLAKTFCCCCTTNQPP